MKVVLSLTQGPHAGYDVILGDLDGERPPEFIANVQIPSLQYAVDFASLIRVKGRLAYYREAFRKPSGRFGQTMESFHPEQK